MIATHNVVEDIRQLSSGTISKLCRDAWFADMGRWLKERYTSRRNFSINPLMAADGRIVDRVQFAFRMFAECSSGGWDTWHECWAAYLNRLADVRFKVGYMGQTDYEIAGERNRVCVKYRTSSYERSISNGTPTDYEMNIRSKVGCCALTSGACDAFPANEIACLFPLAVPAMYVIGQGWVQHPDWPPVELGLDACGDVCVLSSDSMFQPTVEQWDAWRETALKH